MFNPGFRCAHPGLSGGIPAPQVENKNLYFQVVTTFLNETEVILPAEQVLPGFLIIVTNLEGALEALFG